MTPLTCEEAGISQTATVDEALLSLPVFLDEFQQCLGQLKRTASVKRFTTTGDEEQVVLVKMAGTAPFGGDVLIWSNRPVEVHDASNFTFGCSAMKVVVHKLGLPLPEFTAARGPRSKVLSDPRLARFHDEPQRVLSELSKEDAVELARQLEGALSPRTDADDILKNARTALSEALSRRF